MNLMSVSEEVSIAEKRIKKYVFETPLEYSAFLSKLTGAEVYLKLENLQLSGSFKIRGAFNKLLALQEKGIESELITSSTGNHGLAFAQAAQTLKQHGTIVLPENTSKTKLEALSFYNINLEQFGNDCVESELHALEKAQKVNGTYISPYNDLDIIAGQGTIGVEVEKQSSSLNFKPDAVFIPVGGGGLISGIGSYLQAHLPETKIIGCQPLNSPVMHESLKAGKIIEMESLDTISDGTAGGIEPDAITFELCKEIIDAFYLVNEKEIKSALKLIIEKHQYIVEGAAGLSLASLIQNAASYKGQKVVLILCGRRLSISQLKTLLQ
ncbi:threonine/serine dehydratase [Chondrinema litorale]|uniref:threonine/serine dehydratase n=1 Tax=Chondrinema litorale TaxID=2994555 RepID=UPI002542D1D2|nr:threonine/serine dehydratase [Chondrinema litorale]UZR93520.1 threonine/serine dehydratase [Chondrinema litorale]